MQLAVGSLLSGEQADQLDAGGNGAAGLQSWPFQP